MGTVIPLGDQGDFRIAIRRIRHLWEEGRVSWGDHVRERMEQRRLDMLDIQHTIRYGFIEENHVERNTVRYVVKGTAVDGRSLRCVVIVLGSLIFITVMR